MSDIIHSFSVYPVSGPFEVRPRRPVGEGHVSTRHDEDRCRTPKRLVPWNRLETTGLKNTPGKPRDGHTDWSQRSGGLQLDYSVLSFGGGS